MSKKLLILDVDGVLTDGTKTYDIKGDVLSKRFCDTDFTYIRLLKDEGWNVCWLSGDKRVNEPVAKTRGIDFYYCPSTASKGDWFAILATTYDVLKNDMYFIGDGYFDLTLMALLKRENIFCPRTAERCVISMVPMQNHLQNACTGVVEDFYYRTRLHEN